MSRFRRSFWFLFVMISLSMVAACVSVPPAGTPSGAPYAGRTDAIFPGLPWWDALGEGVNAHAVGIFKIDDTYYMVGEKRTDKNDAEVGGNPEDLFAGVSMYSSTDLTKWTNLGTPVKADSGPLLASSLIGERPKLYYNAVTKKYFILVKTMKPGGTSNNYVISSADHVTGPYTYHGALMFGDKNPATGDVNVFVDTDGTGYLITPDGKIYKMSPDFMKIDSLAVDGVWGDFVPFSGYCQSEGPGFFKAGNTYFLLGSHGTFWNANDNFYVTAPAIKGPWTYRGLIAPGGTMTWNSQSGFVLPVSGSSGTTYVYMGDRWVNGHLTSTGMIWLPITVDGDRMSIASYVPAWSLDVKQGTWSYLNVENGGQTVNDSETGQGPQKFSYTGEWSHHAASGSNGGDISTSSTVNSSATIPFSGSQIFLYSLVNGRDMGIMGVSLLDKNGRALVPEAMVSLRTDSIEQSDVLVYASPVMPRDAYQLKIRVTGLKDYNSKGATIAIDRVVIRDNAPVRQLKPYLKIGQGPKLLAATATVASGTGVTLSPEADGDGKWSWSGPGGFHATTREITLKNLRQGGKYTVSWSDKLSLTYDLRISISLNAGAAHLITNRNSGKTLSIKDASSVDGAPSVQLAAAGSPSQKWIITKAGGAYWKIKNAGSGKLLDIATASKEKGAALVQMKASGGDSQLWQLNDLGDGSFQIKNKKSGFMLDVTGASLDDGAATIQWPDNGGLNQVWRIVAP